MLCVMTSCELPLSVTGTLFKLAKLPAIFFFLAHLTDEEFESLNCRDPPNWEWDGWEGLAVPGAAAGAHSSSLNHHLSPAPGTW